MSPRYAEESKNFRLLGHDSSAAFGGGSLVEVHKGYAYVGSFEGGGVVNPITQKPYNVLGSLQSFDNALFVDWRQARKQRRLASRIREFSI